MRYRTGGYAWHSRLLYWWWWALMVLAVGGTVWAAITHQAGGVYAVLISAALGANVSYLSDRYILGGLPTLEQRRGDA